MKKCYFLIFIFYLLLYTKIFAHNELNSIYPGVGYSFSGSWYVNPAVLSDKKETYLKTGSFPAVFGLAKGEFFEIILENAKPLVQNPVAVSLTSISFDENALGGYTWQDNYINLSLCFPSGKKTTSGLTLSYYFLSISESEDIKRTAKGVSLSYGGISSVKKTLQYGWMINNLFSYKRYSSGVKEKDKANLLLGISYRIAPHTTVLVDVHNLIDFDTSYFIPNTKSSVVFGVEKEISDGILLRSALSSEGKILFGTTLMLPENIELNYICFINKKISTFSKFHQTILFSLKI